MKGWKNIVVLCAMLLSVNDIWATHSTGLDLTYQCLGGDTFFVRLAFYRDCAGIDAPGIGGRPLPTVDVTSATCAINFNATLPLLSWQEAGAVCPSFQTTCSGGTYPGVEEYIYGDTIILPAACIDWIFSYGLCCRNNAITTINPTNVDIYVEAELNNVAAPCNNSPVFTVTPVPFICVGSSYCFNNGAVDPDGDSLYYSLVTPTTGPNPNDTVNYVGGYSPTNPLTSTPALTLDPITGDICMSPTLLEVTVLQVRIEEWRNGVFIGFVERDIQIRIINCIVPNVLPTVNGINGTGVFTASICAGTPFCFFTNAIDPDIGQTVTMTWNAGIPNATFNVTPDSLPTGNFCWTPDSTDISTAPHCFTVTVVDDNCPFLGSQVYSFCLTVFGYMATNVVTQDESCVGDCDGQATVNISGGFPPYTYLWDDPLVQTTPTASNLCPGTYNVIVTDSIGCAPSNSAVINPAVPITFILDSTAITCNGQGDGTATITPAGGTGTYNYLWNSVPPQSTQTATGLNAGTYTVTVTDGNNCDTSATVIITEPAVFGISISAFTNASCDGLSDGTASVSMNGGTPPFTVLWNAAAGNQTDSTATGLAAGTYGVTVTDAGGCIDSTTVTIIEPLPLSASISGSINVSCFGGNDGSATVAVVGGTMPYSYLWGANANNQTTATATSLLVGTYGVMVTDTNGCQDSTTITITEPPSSLTLNVATTSVSCYRGNDGTATAIPSGGTPPYTYQWDPTTGNQTTATAINLFAGTYGVTVYDSNDCISNPGIVVMEPAPLFTTISFTNANCFGGNDGTATISISGGTAPYSVLWDAAAGSQTDSTAINLSAGTYQVNITDTNGCSLDTNVTVGQPVAGLSLNTSIVNLNCFGDVDGSATVSISGGTAPYVVLWDAATGSQTDSTAINLSAGNYGVLVTDTNGCSDSVAVIVTEPQILITSISDSIDVSCFGGNDGSATVSVSGGTPPFTYLWDAAAGNQTDSTATGLSIGTYSVIVTDTNGCQDSSSVIIGEPTSSISLVITTTNASCFGGSDGTATATPSGGTPPYTYLWDPSAGSQTDSTAIGLVAGVYGVTVYDLNGCIYQPGIIVGEPNPIVLSVSPNDTVCPGALSVIGATATGGNGGYVFTWNQGLPNFANHSVSPTVETTYTVSVTDALGCTGNTDSVTLYVYSFNLSGLITTSGGDVCAGDLTTISGNYTGGLGSFTFSWYQNTTNISDTLSYQEDTISTIPVTPTDTTDYILVVTDQCSNSITDTVTVNAFPYPIINLAPIYAQGCEPLTVNFIDSLNDNTGMTYLWSFGDGVPSLLSNPSYIYMNDGTYNISLAITSAQGCASSSTTNSVVNVYPGPTAIFSANPEITDIQNPTIIFDNQSTGAVSYNWNFGNGDTSIAFSPVYTYSDTGIYIVNLLVTSLNGCTDMFELTIVIEPFYTFNVPNAFTPNPNGPGTGVYDIHSLTNDVFYPFTEYVEEFQLLIFNRWGELIFESNDLSIGWDGYYRGNICQQDTYVWKINITYTDGEKLSKVGDVTLMR